ncbi:MAG: hypothetical protein Q8R37_01080 [Nanoarchaeota archaeon]|nr:hypothetical protein [Nanoarchaeota archaeon]
MHWESLVQEEPIDCKQSLLEHISEAQWELVMQVTSPFGTRLQMPLEQILEVHSELLVQEDCGGKAHFHWEEHVMLPISILPVHRVLLEHMPDEHSLSPSKHVLPACFKTQRVVKLPTAQKPRQSALLLHPNEFAGSLQLFLRRLSAEHTPEEHSKLSLHSARTGFK